jgi:uncharacterized protein (TIGR00251 family)
MPLNLKADSDGVRFAVLVRPRSSQNRIAGVHDGALKIHLTTPPVEGAANKACLKFVARALGVSPSRVSLVIGQKGRNKTLRVEGLSAVEFGKKIAALIPGDAKEPA